MYAFQLSLTLQIRLKSLSSHGHEALVPLPHHLVSDPNYIICLIRSSPLLFFPYLSAINCTSPSAQLLFCQVLVVYWGFSVVSFSCLIFVPDKASLIKYSRPSCLSCVQLLISYSKSQMRLKNSFLPHSAPDFFFFFLRCLGKADISRVTFTLSGCLQWSMTRMLSSAEAAPMGQNVSSNLKIFCFLLLMLLLLLLFCCLLFVVGFFF